MFKKSLSAVNTLSLLAVCSLVSMTASAADTGGAWDYSPLTNSVDYSGVKTGALTAFGLMVVVVAGIWGGKRIMRIFG